MKQFSQKLVSVLTAVTLLLSVATMSGGIIGQPNADNDSPSPTQDNLFDLDNRL